MSILVTGATDGIGKATARALVARGERVLVHGRSLSKAEAVAVDLRRTFPDSPTPLAVAADLADLRQVEQLAKLLATTDVRVLLHNAGVFARDRRESADGYELTFAVNHLAPFALTRALLPTLQKRQDPRVVAVASGAHHRGAVHPDDLARPSRYDGNQAYANSKLCNVLFANALARRAPWLSANSLHPGVISTKLLHAGFGPGGASVEDGARTSVLVATSPELRGVSGRYFSDAREARPSAAARDEGLQDRLWEVSEALVDRAWGR